MDFQARDLAIVVATLLGPFLAVYVTERQRRKADARERKVRIFRSLMSLRAAPLAAGWVESFNLVEVEFDPSKPAERRVLDCWKLCLQHLNTRSADMSAWGQRRAELMVDLLYEMAKVLGYAFDRSAINVGTYYPVGYGDMESEYAETRQAWLQVLRGERQLPVSINIHPAATGAASALATTAPATTSAHPARSAP